MSAAEDLYNNMMNKITLYSDRGRNRLMAHLGAFAILCIGVFAFPWLRELRFHHRFENPGIQIHGVRTVVIMTMITSATIHLFIGLPIIGILSLTKRKSWLAYAVGGIIGLYLAIVIGDTLGRLNDGEPSELCWWCLFSPMTCLTIWPFAILWGVTYWRFAVRVRK